MATVSALKSPFPTLTPNLTAAMAHDHYSQTRGCPHSGQHAVGGAPAERLSPMPPMQQRPAHSFSSPAHPKRVTGP